MHISNRLLYWMLGASALLHLVVLTLEFMRPAAPLSPGTNMLSARLMTPAPAQPPPGPRLNVLPDIPAAHTAHPPAGAGSPDASSGSGHDHHVSYGFTDEAPWVGKYPVLPLPLHNRSIPYLPPRLPWQISPHYPEAAFARRVKGYVRLELLIDRIGEVVSVRVTEAQPKGMFDEAAWRAFHGARFEPAYEYGRPIASKVSVRVVFDPDDKRVPRPEPTALE